MKYFLKIFNFGDVPYCFYKDEGGKEKSMDLKVCLLDENKNVVEDKTISLTTQLKYHNGELVQNQSIFNFTSDSNSLIQGSKFAHIKLRINEVSSRHQVHFRAEIKLIPE